MRKLAIVSIGMVFILSVFVTAISADFYVIPVPVQKEDPDLVPENIKSGINIFGVEGKLHGGCTCEGTLNGTRWCDNEDGTVTDLSTCLVWLRKADWGGAKQWRCGNCYDDAHSRAGLLYAGAPGANLSDGSVAGDWRLPTKNELYVLANGTEAVSLSSPRAFTGVQGIGYWSSNTSEYTAYMAYYLSGYDGSLYVDYKWETIIHVWPVRAGN